MVIVDYILGSSTTFDPKGGGDHNPSSNPWSKRLHAKLNNEMNHTGQIPETTEYNCYQNQQ